MANSQRNKDHKQDLKILYLAGPLCDHENNQQWRNVVTRQLMYLYHIIDPYKTELKGSSDKVIVETDKEDVKRCDILLLYHFDKSDGSAMEQMLAHTYNKLVILVCEDESIISPWTRYHSHIIYNNLSDAIKFLKEEVLKYEVSNR